VAEPLTPRARQIVQVARQLLEQEGGQALAMRRLADRLGIRAPSLYKHLPDKAALEAAIIATGLEDIAAAVEPPWRRPRILGPSRWLPSPTPTAPSRWPTPTCTG
jgi:AcrR family transcriptional regulator